MSFSPTTLSRAGDLGKLLRKFFECLEAKIAEPAIVE
jgi:hypothetical protein